MISGDTRVATLEFKHYYTSTVSKDVTPITYNDNTRKIIVNIDKIVLVDGKETVDSSWNKAGVSYDLLVRDGVNGWEKASLVPGDAITGIRINVENDSGIEDAGTELRVTVTVKNVTENEDHGNSSDVIAYTKPRYDGAGQVAIGIDGKNAMTLSLRDYKSTDGYDIQRIENKYYTFVKIDCYDQRQITNKASKLNITYSMLGTNLADITNGTWDKIVVTGSVNDALEIIGARKDGNNKYISVDSNIEYIGIAIKNATVANAIKNGSVSIYFGNNTTPKRTFTPINVKVADIANVNVTLGNASGHCYEEVNVATLKSGTGEDELDPGLVGYKVYKGSVSDSNLVANLTESGSYRKATDKDFGFIESQEKPGEVKVKFWAKNAGSYIIIPYVIRTNNSATTQIPYTVSEDKTVNKIRFGEKTQSGSLIQKDVVEAKTAAKTDFGVEFYHIYENVDGRPEKKITDVPYNSVICNKETSVSSIWDVDSIYEGLVFDVDPSGAVDEKIVEGIRVEIPEEVGIDKSLRFYITVGSYRYPENAGSYITVKTKAPAVADRVSVGNSSSKENIPLYEIAPNVAPVNGIYDVDYNNRKYSIYADGTYYYTLLPISLKDSNKNDVISDSLTDKEVKADMQVGTNKGEVTFIDDINDREHSRTMAKSKARTYSNPADYPYNNQAWIGVQGFVRDKASASGYRKARTGEIWEYVGIHITYDPEDGIWLYQDEDFENGEQFFLKNIYVYYTDANGKTSCWKTLELGVIGKAARNSRIIRQSYKN